MKNKDLMAINTIRVLSAEGVQKANSGHPGLPMGSAPMAFTLWSKYMKHSPKNPGFVDRDRFVLGGGHGSMLLYSLLHLFGYGLTAEDLANFRQLDSKTPGHPEYGHTKGVEVTTGPLGQGLANGVGMAIAETKLAVRFNKPDMKLIDHYTYVLSGDGCFMEGIASEAASLAGTLELGKLIVFYDSNNITIEGDTDIAFRENVAKRFDAYGWQTLNVEDGNDVEAIGEAIAAAKAETGKPTLITVKTMIGFGCPSKQGKASAHGEPLGEQCLIETKENLAWEEKNWFSVPAQVRDYMKEITDRLSETEANWNKLFEEYKAKYQVDATEFDAWMKCGIPVDKLDSEDFWKYDMKPNATRNSSSDVLNRISAMIPNITGGSADLAPSNKSVMKGKGDYSAENRNGMNLHFGVREHAMAAIANGIAVHGGFIPYVATFFVFSDYMKAAMRLSAIMKLPVIYILTHDSIGVGEDGPTHEPVEQLAALRSMPGINVFRPADNKETAAAWYSALTTKDTPTALVLTRQNLPQMEVSGKNSLKGAYIIKDSVKKTPDIILMATGSEVQLAIEAEKLLREKGVDARVISMPCLELFEAQGEEYKNAILPKETRARLAIEAATSFGWHKYTGLDGDVISIETFGASAPYESLFKKFGLTVENVVNKALGLIK